MTAVCVGQNAGEQHHFGAEQESKSGRRLERENGNEKQRTGTSTRVKGVQSSEGSDQHNQKTGVPLGVVGGRPWPTSARVVSPAQGWL